MELSEHNIQFQIVETGDTKYTIIGSDDGIAGWIEKYSDGKWEFNPTGDYAFELDDLMMIAEKLKAVIQYDKEAS